MLSHVSTGPDAIVTVGSGLVGLGVGASVSPALFISGFSLSSAQMQRVFALIELLRGVAAFLVAPIVLHRAQTVSRQRSAWESPPLLDGIKGESDAPVLAPAPR